MFDLADRTRTICSHVVDSGIFCHHLYGAKAKHTYKYTLDNSFQSFITMRTVLTLVFFTEESVSCFGETATPSCSAGFTMDFAYVNYGRTDGSTCPHVAMSDQDCTSTPVIINDNCQGQETCSVAVTTSNMGGDPCGGTFKYLHLKWLCVSNGA